MQSSDVKSTVSFSIILPNGKHLLSQQQQNLHGCISLGPGPSILTNYRTKIPDDTEAQGAQDHEHRVSIVHCLHLALSAAALEHPGDLLGSATVTGSTGGQHTWCCNAKLLAKGQSALVGIPTAPALESVGCSGFCLGPDLTDST